MNQIVSVILNTLKSSSSILGVEQTLITALSQELCNAFGQALAALDAELCLNQPDYQIQRIDQRSIQTLLGNLVYRRRLVRDKSGRTFYPLDVQLGIAPHRRFSPFLMAQASRLASRSTMRATALAFELLTSTSISPQTVDKLVREAGQEVEAVRQAELYAESEEPRRAVPQLFIEGDAFIVGSQGKGRGMLVHRIQISEGAAQHGKRRELVNRHIISSLSNEEAFEETQNYLHQNYDLKHTLVVTGSDNGSGYEPERFSELAIGAAQHIHVLDSYHLNRKIKERLSFVVAGIVKKVRNAVYAGNLEALTVALDTAESVAAAKPEFSEEAVEQVRLLRQYLRRNWDCILPHSQGKWAGLGSCESNHRRYTYRLKHQGRSWSKAGIQAMLRIIDCEQNGDLIETLAATPMMDTAIAPEFTGIVRDLLKPAFSVHTGATAAHISVDAPTSSPLGQLAKNLSM